VIRAAYCCAASDADNRNSPPDTEPVKVRSGSIASFWPQTRHFRSTPISGQFLTGWHASKLPIGDIGLERKRPPTEASIANSRRGFFYFLNARLLQYQWYSIGLQARK
jgi:hypothetical protein